MQLGHDGLQLDFQVTSIMSHLTDSSLLKLVMLVCWYEIGQRFSDTSDVQLKFKPIIVCCFLFFFKRRVQWSTSMPWWKFQFMLGRYGATSTNLCPDKSRDEEENSLPNHQMSKTSPNSTFHACSFNKLMSAVSPGCLSFQHFLASVQIKHTKWKIEEICLRNPLKVWF